MHKQIKRLFIANRGEILRRIAVSAKLSGIETVAIAQHGKNSSFLDGIIDHFIRVEEENVALYLDAKNLVRLAAENGCDSIHPGFGFLSENFAFAKATLEAGLIWVGPNPNSIQEMASKAVAKKIASTHKVPCVPAIENFHWSEGGDLSAVKEFAKSCGYPILVKAALGGGGKGMRLVKTDDDLAPALSAAASEAKSSFGDSTLIVEKYVGKARHIEVQVFGDQHGHIVTLGDRDCSVQRRHQKIIEEAPAVGLSDATRQKMHEAALAVAKAVNYVSAGTVEFLLDWSDETKSLPVQKFYFLEMNTRLQVEHPVTEEVFGLDLVDLQLKVACGYSLKHFKPFNTTPLAHSVEARIYAEDPENNYLPSPGPVDAFLPFESTHIRWEVGIDPIDEVTPKFDPMIAKVIATGQDRASAIAKLKNCIQQTVFAGPKNNLTLLQRILDDETFTTVPVTTDFLEHKSKALLAKAEECRLAVAQTIEALLPSILGSPASTSANPFAQRTERIFAGGATEGLRLSHAHAPKKPFTSSQRSFAKDGDLLQWGLCDAPDLNAKARWAVLRSRDYIKKIVNIGGVIETSKQSFADNENFGSQSHSGSDKVIAPVPGKVKKILVKPSTSIQKNEVILILESMKMEFEVRSPRDGQIAQLHVDLDQQIDADALLLTWQNE
ncbi:MAG: biotin carboxylase N-terminal domain-containing protein [Oligoflexales bacterium]